LTLLRWQARALAAADPARLQFLLPGVLQALALVFKVGQRPALLQAALGERKRGLAVRQRRHRLQ
jgi:hypothetical protein